MHHKTAAGTPTLSGTATSYIATDTLAMLYPARDVVPVQGHR